MSDHLATPFNCSGSLFILCISPYLLLFPSRKSLCLSPDEKKAIKVGQMARKNGFGAASDATMRNNKGPKVWDLQIFIDFKRNLNPLNELKSHEFDASRSGGISGLNRDVLTTYGSGRRRADAKKSRQLIRRTAALINPLKLKKKMTKIRK